MTAHHALVLDASVVVKWFVEEDPEEDARAILLLENVRDTPARFLAPALLLYETHAVLCRKLDNAGRVTSCMEMLWRLGIRIAPLDLRTAALAATEARTLGLTGYDAVYLATAKLYGSAWATFDKRACARVKDKQLVHPV